MKRLLLLPLFVLFSFPSYSQGSKKIAHKKHSSIQHRVEVLICKLKYKEILDRIERDSLVTLGTVIEENVAKCQIGRLPQKDRRGVICYTIRYDLDKDKIISITEQG